MKKLILSVTLAVFAATTTLMAADACPKAAAAGAQKPACCPSQAKAEGKDAKVCPMSQQAKAGCCPAGKAAKQTAKKTQTPKGAQVVKN